MMVDLLFGISYAFDIETKDERGQDIPLRLKNRRLFAFADCGGSDIRSRYIIGIVADTNTRFIRRA